MNKFTDRFGDQFDLPPKRRRRIPLLAFCQGLCWAVGWLCVGVVLTTIVISIIHQLN